MLWKVPALDESTILKVRPEFPATTVALSAVHTSFATGTAKLDAIVVAPPARLSFTLKDPSSNGTPIVRAVVRVFAEPPNRGPPAIEIARSMTDEKGQCEILLAQQHHGKVDSATERAS